MSPRKKAASLVTGFPAFTARKMAERLSSAGERVFVLCRPKFAEACRQFAEGHRGVEPLVGDVLDLDLGLSGPELKKLARHVTVVHHMAAIYYLGAATGLAERVNVEGTANVLDVVGDFDSLSRFVFHSTAFVAGDRTGVILEEELDAGQRFRNPYEKSKFEAERLVRSKMRELPLSVVRPSVIVGDSRTGEIDRMDGPYYLIRAICSLPMDVSLPLPEGGAYPLNLVPVDFVVAAADIIAKNPDCVSKTFHLVDPNPLPARKVFEIVADLAERKRPHGAVPSKLLARLMKFPLLERVLRPQRHFLEYLSSLTIFNCMNTLEALKGTGVSCPPFPSYARALVQHVKCQLETRRATRERDRDALFGEEDAFC